MAISKQQLVEPIKNIKKPLKIQPISPSVHLLKKRDDIIYEIEFLIL
jgi:hypothetical protein